jgi:adenylate cyclase
LCEADFAFCPNCGAARDGRPAAGRDGPLREADRRQVTVLFADLSGFTTLSERLDAEVVREFQNALFDALSQAVRRRDGYVAKFMGDAVLALFGAPLAHEDDAERALETALDMLASGAALDRAWRSRLGQPVSLHIAVHTGPVVAGTLSDKAGGTYDVTGDTVNTASRLLAAAPSGTVLTTDATHALTRHRFAFEPAGEVALRGKTEPVAAFRLTGMLAEPGTSRGLEALGLRTPFIGRADELEQLLAAFHRMKDGKAQLVRLVGEAGTGKSRLIAELLASLESRSWQSGVAIRRVACSSSGEPTYGAVAKIVRQGYQVDAADSAEVARRKLTAGLRGLGAPDRETEAIAPVLAYVLGIEHTAPPDVEPEQLHRQIVLAARTLFERRLAQQPLLLVVDDLHWADAASIDLMHHVVDELADRPLMLLLSHRPDLRPVPLAHADHWVVPLPPLTSEQARALVTGLFGPALDEASAQLRDFVATRSGGNPFFVEEIMRSLVGKGVLVRQDDRWTCTEACEAVDVPPTLQGLLLSRADRLPAEARRLLQEAAVLGAEFDEALLRAVATVPASVETELDRLLEVDLVRPFEDGPDGRRYRFTHALVHEVIYQNLLQSSRAVLHGRVAKSLESTIGPHPARLGDLVALGHHWSLSTDKFKGAAYLLAAGDWARALYANDDAIRLYERALCTLGECRDRAGEVRAARERLADLLGLTGRRGEALAHYEAVREELESAAGRADAARLLRKIGGLHWEAGDRERAAASFASGLERLDDAGDPIERAHLYQEMGRLAFRAGDSAAAITWAERALVEAASDRATTTDVTRQREATAMRAQAYNTLGVAFARTGRLAEATRQIEQSIELAEAGNMLQAACRGYTNLGVLYSSLDPRRSIETCLRGLETAKKVGDLAFESRICANLAVAYCALTDRCEALGIEAAQRAIELDRRLGLLDHLAVPLIVLGQIHQCHGEHAQALTSYREALELAEQVGEPQLLFPCYDGLATLYLDAGNQTEAEFYLAKAQEVCERSGLEPDALIVLPFLC